MVPDVRPLCWKVLNENLEGIMTKPKIVKMKNHGHKIKIKAKKRKRAYYILVRIRCLN